MTSRVFVAALLVGLGATACRTVPEPRGTAGTLLAIGGGLDDDSQFVYERLLALAAAHGPARIAIVTAATGPEQQEAIDKAEALRAWAPGVAVDVIWRDTPTEATVAAIEGATALFFTGGDQARITARYRPDGAATPEWLAMRGLLARGGVIAGASAGCAMLGREMLLGGDSAAALRDGARVGPGMAFVDCVLTDSHFFERDRLGRLVAAAMGGSVVGLGVGEDAAVEIDLATGVATGLTTAQTLLVDARRARRDGGRWTGLRARLLGRGERWSLRDGAGDAAVPPPPVGAPSVVPVVEPGQNRQLASWRVLRFAQQADGGCWRLAFDGWALLAWPDGQGAIALQLELTP